MSRATPVPRPVPRPAPSPDLSPPRPAPSCQRAARVRLPPPSPPIQSNAVPVRGRIAHNRVHFHCNCYHNSIPSGILSRCAGFGRYSEDWRLRELGDLELRDVCMVFGYSRRIRSPTSSPRGAQDQPQEGSKMDRSGQFNGVIFKSFWSPWGVRGEGLGRSWGGGGGILEGSGGGVLGGSEGVLREVLEALLRGSWAVLGLS